MTNHTHIFGPAGTLLQLPGVHCFWNLQVLSEVLLDIGMVLHLWSFGMIEPETSFWRHFQEPAFSTHSWIILITDHSLIPRFGVTEKAYSPQVDEDGALALQLLAVPSACQGLFGDFNKKWQNEAFWSWKNSVCHIAQNLCLSNSPESLWAEHDTFCTTQKSDPAMKQPTFEKEKSFARWRLLSQLPKYIAQLWDAAT